MKFTSLWRRATLVALICLIRVHGLGAQPDDLSERIQKLRQNPVLQQLLDQNKSGLTETQKRLLERAVDNLSEEDLAEILKAQGLSQDGSVTLQKDRLKTAIGITPAPEMPGAPAKSSIAIENAAEGEFLRGEDEGAGLMTLRGRIRLRLSSGLVLADTVIVDTKRQEIFAEGNVVYYKDADKEGKGGEIRADRFLYDQRLGTGILYNADGYLSPIYFMGKSIQQISEKKISVSHIYFTTCANKRPHYNFTARKLWIYEDDKIVAVGVLYYVGGIPLLPLPFLYASPWGTGIITQVGHGDIQGFYMQNTYQFSVPEAYAHDFLPIGYRFKADVYENTGHSFGIDFFRFTPGLNYYVELGASEFHRYDALLDSRDRGGLRITNAVQKNDGTYGKDYYKWYKAFMILNYRYSNFKNNQVRNVQLRYEDYSHRMYEFEFGGRFQPTSTIPALYEKGEADRGLFRNDTNWNLVYSEAFDDLSVRVQASRNRVWQEASKFQDSKYIPVTDVVPAVDIKKNWHIGKLPFFESPVIWENKLHSDLTKQYSNGDVFQTTNLNSFTSGLRTFIAPLQMISVTPFAGYGAQKTVPYSPSKTTYKTTGPVVTGGGNSTEFKALDRESAKQSYQFWFTEDEFILGPDLIFLRATYRRKQSFREEEKEAPAVNASGLLGPLNGSRPFNQNQKVHEIEGSLEAYPVNRLSLSLMSIYDLKKYQFDVKQKERWYYPVFRVDYYLDFINMFREERENLLTRRKAHFLGLRLSNDYVYDPKNKRDHSDVVGMTFEAGGFDLWLLKRLRYFEMGYYWYHVYYNQELDHMRYSVKADIQLLGWLFWEMELESRATEIERYKRNSRDENNNYDYVSFPQDVVNSTGLAGKKRRENSVFNIGTFETALIMDLHDFEFRLGYRMEQRSMLAGSLNVENVTFYDNKVFFSLTLLRFDIGGTADRPSRFILDRRRVRPQDVGRLPVQTSRLQ
ncbi:MAG: LPS-assembly protein LptD [Leptospirales bacterium]|nr:LPS-assembly protein LptD [Leptospirales bacterium]